MHDYVLFCNNQRGRGIALYVLSEIKYKPLSHAELRDNSRTETLWVHVRPNRLPRSVSCVLYGVVYHPADATSEDNDVFYKHIQDTVDQYSKVPWYPGLLKYPECLICMFVDFNPTSTTFSASKLKRMCGLTQSVKLLIRDSGILDWCLMNRPRLMSSPVQLPKIGKSDHYTILVEKRQCENTCKPHKKSATRRDTRARRIWPSDYYSRLVRSFKASLLSSQG